MQKGDSNGSSNSYLDKLFEVGLLHSLVTIVSICLLLMFIEWIAGKLMNKNSYEYSLTASFYMFSHLFIDILDGGLFAY